MNKTGCHNGDDNLLRHTKLKTKANHSKVTFPSSEEQHFWDKPRQGEQIGML